MKVLNNSQREIFLATALFGTFLLPSAKEVNEKVIPSETEVPDEALEAAVESPVIAYYFNEKILQLVGGEFNPDGEDELELAKAELATAESHLAEALSELETAPKNGKAAAQEKVNSAQEAVNFAKSVLAELEG